MRTLWISVLLVLPLAIRQLVVKRIKVLRKKWILQNKISHLKIKRLERKWYLKLDSDEDSCANDVESSSNDSDENPLKSSFEKGLASKDNLPHNEVVTEHVLEGAVNFEKISIYKDNLPRESGL